MAFLQSNQGSLAVIPHHINISGIRVVPRVNEGRSHVSTILIARVCRDGIGFRRVNHACKTVEWRERSANKAVHVNSKSLKIQKCYRDEERRMLQRDPQIEIDIDTNTNVVWVWEGELIIRIESGIRKRKLYETMFQVDDNGWGWGSGAGVSR